MSQIVTLKPISKQGAWFFSLKMDDDSNRQALVIDKIQTLYHQGMHGNLDSLLELYAWYQHMLKVDELFGKEIVRINDIIRHKFDGDIGWIPNGQEFHYKAATPIAMVYCNLLIKYDKLMACVESCFLLGVLKERRVFNNFTYRYMSKLSKLMTKICQKKINSEFTKPAKLNEEQQVRLLKALNLDVMPIYPKKVYVEYKKLVHQ